MKAKQFSVVLLFLFMFSIFVVGCSKNESASTNQNEMKTEEKTPKKKDKKMEIDELLNGTNIAVIDDSKAKGRDNWAIEQIEKKEVIKDGILKEFFGLEIIYNSWYGQDDLKTLNDSVNTGIKKSIKIDILGLVPILKVMDTTKKIVEFLLDSLKQLFSSEEISYRTIKIMTYAYVGQQYDTVPYGYFKEFLNQRSETKITIYDEGGEWVARGGYDVSPTTALIRTKSSVRIYNGHGIKSFQGIETPDLISSETQNGTVVADKIRKLVSDVYAVLDDKEPKFYPEYAKALVKSYESEEENFAEQFAREIALEKGDFNDDNYLSLLDWGMSVEELKKAIPNASEENGNDGMTYLSVKEDRYSSTTCVKSDTVSFNFMSGKLDSITYRFDLKKECNKDDQSAKEIVYKGFKELYQQVVSDYDPTHKMAKGELNSLQQWESQTSEFRLAFWVALDVSPAMPYGDLTISKLEDNAPVVITDDNANNWSKKGEEVANTPLSPKDWVGDWSETNAHSGRSLKITNQTSSTFDFQLNVSNGGNTGLIKGTANLTTEDTAEYPEDDMGCEVSFFHLDESIEVTSNELCDGYKGAGVGPFEGNYPKGNAEQSTTFNSIGMLPENIDAKLKDLTGDKYGAFIERFGTYSKEEDIDGFGSTVYSGFLTGVAQSFNGIIMYKDSGEIWAAYFDGTTLFYYTNVEEQQEAMPKTIKNHYADTADLKVEFMSKE
ncbi:hypothetical protein [Guptibacillus spartinae]|uniref:hypothetical protein n=1 Tax=Guptibacillus spartinae TaxID=3025679 RepID=UPI0023629D39|nr:hypothetical protein [Pseudalkalibacillus spartinae]